MARKLCPCCKQMLPPEVVVGLPVNTVKARLFLLIKEAGAAGIDSKKLFEGLYGISAGPLSGLRNLHVMIWQINKRLVAHNKVIRNKGNRRGGNNSLAIYYLTRHHR